MITSKLTWLKWWHVITAFITVHLLAVYFFVEGYLPTYFDPLINLSDLDHENSLGTYYSFILLFLCAAGAFIIANKAKKADSTFYFWALLSTLLLYMSIDESLSLHERVMGPMEDYFGSSLDGTFFAFSWLVIGIPFLLTFVVALYKLSANIPKKTKQTLLLALTIYVTGAFIFEGLVGVTSPSTIVYRTFFTGTEEILEIIGITIAFNEIRRVTPISFKKSK